MEDSIQQWEELTDTILKNFLSVYFDDNAPYYFWVGNEIGGVVALATAPNLYISR